MHFSKTHNDGTHSQNTDWLKRLLEGSNSGIWHKMEVYIHCMKKYAEETELSRSGYHIFLFLNSVSLHCKEAICLL